MNELDMALNSARIKTEAKVAEVKAIARASELTTDDLLRRICGPFWVRWIQTENTLLATIQVLLNRSDKKDQILLAMEVAARKASPHVRFYAIEAIGLLGPSLITELPDILLLSLSDRNMSVRVAGLKAVGRFGRASISNVDHVKRVIAEYLKTPNLPVIVMIWGSFALACIGESPHVQVKKISEFLALDEVRAARNAINSLGRRIDQETYSRLRSRLFEVSTILTDYKSALSHNDPAWQVAGALAIAPILSIKLEALRALAELGALASPVEGIVENLYSHSKELEKQRKKTLAAIRR